MAPLIVVLRVFGGGLDGLDIINLVSATGG